MKGLQPLEFEKAGRAGQASVAWNGILAKSESRQENRGTTNKKGGRLAAFPNPEARDLQNLYVLRLPALGSLDHVERDSLALLQAAEAIRLDCRIVNKYVFAILTADEAVALRVIEPLNRSLFHGDAYSFEVM